MKKLILLLMLLSCFTPIQAQNSDPNGAQDDQYATVILYRTRGVQREYIKILERDIEWLATKDSKAEYKVKAGEVTIYTKAGPEVPCKITVELVAGETYYIKNYFKMGFVADRSMVKVVSNDVGEKECKKIKN